MPTSDSTIRRPHVEDGGLISGPVEDQIALRQQCS